MSQYSISDRVYAKSSPDLKPALLKAYQAKERPLCMCKSNGIPMYIAKHPNGELLIKRMPNTGFLHHPDCDSFEIPAELSGRGAIDSKAIAEDQDTGLTALKLDFSMSKMSTSRTVERSEGGEKTAVSADPSKLSIRSVLHYLYEEAGLNKWSPRMAGKRNWFIIRKHLLEAAQNKIVRKSPLTDHLFIPEVFKLDDKDAIAGRRKQFFASLKGEGNKQPMGILIGEVKEIGEARFGHKLIIKHMPDSPIYLADDVYKRMNKAFASELSCFQEYEHIHLLAICTFVLTASGNPTVDTLSMMVVDQNWLPFESIEDLELVERLCTADRHFIKGLRYNLPKSDVIASALLTDTQEDPTALYLVPPGCDESYYQKLDAVISESELKSHIWDHNKEESFVIP